MNRQIAVLNIVIAFLIVTSTVQAEPNLVAYWEFEEGSGTDANDSAGTNDGTLIGEPNWVAGFIGDYALDFNDVADYIDVPDDPSLRFTQYDSFSISFWAKPTSGGYVVCKMRSSCSSYSFGYFVSWSLSDSKFQFRVERSCVGDVAIYTSDNSAPAGSWYHVVAVYDNKAMYIYLNGQPEDSGTFSYDTGSTTPDKNLAIGARSVDSKIDSYFGGKIDDVRIYDKALSAEEITALYAAGLDKPAIGFSPAGFEFTAGAGGANPADQVLGIYNIGPNTLNWAISEDCNWLTVEPNTGSSTGETDDVNLSVDITALVTGSYNCQLTISDPNASNSPQTVDVNLTLSGPVIELSPTEFEFTADEGGANPADQVLSISNIGEGTLNWEITEDCNWLTAEPNTGSSTGEADDVNLSVDITGLAWGNHNCQLTISDPCAENNPQTVNVNLTLSGPVIELSATEFEFTADEGGANPASQVLSISNSGASTLNWEITEDCGWLTAEPNTGSSTGETDDANLSVDITGLAWGNYNCQLTISDPCAENSPQTVNVNLTINGPVIVLSSTEFEFTVMEGQANPADQVLAISNSGPGTLNWQITEDCNWLTAEPNTGSSTGEADDVNLSVDITSLARGSYSCELTISAPLAENNPQTVTVTLNLMNANFPISLNYNAETYAYAHIPDFPVPCATPKTAEDQDFLTNSRAKSLAVAGDGCWEYCLLWQLFIGEQLSSTEVSVDGVYNSSEAWLVSNLKGWGSWSFNDECSSESGSGTGSGNGNGHGLVVGKIGIGLCEGYPEEPIDLILKLDAEVTGDAPGSWQSWDWWLKIWDSDYNNPLVIMNDSNLSADLDVLAGETLNFRFYHEAQKDFWPEAGLDSTVEIDLFVGPIADFDEDGDVNLPDFAILASQWLQEPGIPSADIEPPGGDDIVDWNDLALMVDYWLWGTDKSSESEPNLVYHWKFDEGNGTNTKDSAGICDGILYGEPNWIAGYIGSYALDFNGVADYVDVGIMGDFGMNMDNLTVSAWVKSDVTNQAIALLGTSNDGATTAFDIALNRDCYGNVLAGYIVTYIRDEDNSNISGSTSSSTAITDGGWHHLAVVIRKSSGVVEIYVDSSSKPISYWGLQGTGTNFSHFAYPLAIGANNSRGTIQAYFDGLIDDVHIYDKALSAEDIQEICRDGLAGRAFNPTPCNGAENVNPNTVLTWLPGKDALLHDVYFGTSYGDVNDATTASDEYQGRQDTNNWDVNNYDSNGLEPNSTFYWRIDEVNAPDANAVKGNTWSFTIWALLDDSNLVSWWGFEEGSGADANDSAGTNDGTLIGEPNWVAGYIGSYALDFNGVADYVDVGTMGDFATNMDNLTVSAWVKSSITNQALELLGTCNDGANTSFDIALNRDCYGNVLAGYIVTYIRDEDNSNISGSTSSSTAITNGSWHHLVVVIQKSSGIIKIYVDSSSKPISYYGPQGTGTNFSNFEYPFVIGANNGRGTIQAHFDGLIDDVRIYDRALSDEEIGQLY